MNLALGGAISALLAGAYDTDGTEAAAFGVIAAFVADAGSDKLLEILLDAAADKTRGTHRHRRIGAIVLKLLERESTSTTFSTALDNLLHGPTPTNRLKLSAAICLRAAFVSGLSSCACKAAIIEAIIRALCACAMPNGSSAQCPSKLMAASADAATLCYADLLSNAGFAPTATALVPTVRSLLAALRAWRCGQWAFSSACEELQEALAHDLHGVGARSFRTCAPLLLCNVSVASKRELRAQVGEQGGGR